METKRTIREIQHKSLVPYTPSKIAPTSMMNIEPMPLNMATADFSVYVLAT